jgi:uncharacterized protein (TIGR02246 family)
MTTTDITHAQVRNAIAAWTTAASSKDLDAISACYAPDVRAFDAIAALEFQGMAAYREHWAQCLDMVPGEMRFEVHDLKVEAAGDLAVAHYLAHCACTGEDGTEQAGWMRATVCLRKTDGKWLIVHEHYSAPFDPMTVKALCDLKPAKPTVKAA